MIGIRSFGAHPTLVSTMTAAAVDGFHQAGEVTVAKHFPGHGDTDVDSHTGLPVIHHTLRQWWQIDAPPFQAAIRAGVRDHDRPHQGSGARRLGSARLAVARHRHRARGLAGEPAVSPSAATDAADSSRQRNLARELADRSITVVANDREITGGLRHEDRYLPLRSKRVYVAGPAAAGLTAALRPALAATGGRPPRC